MLRPSTPTRHFVLAAGRGPVTPHDQARAVASCLGQVTVHLEAHGPATARAVAHGPATARAAAHVGRPEALAPEPAGHRRENSQCLQRGQTQRHWGKARSPEDLAVLLHAAASRLGSQSAATRVAGARVRATGLEEGRAGRLLHPEVRAQGSSLAGGPGAFDRLALANLYAGAHRASCLRSVGAPAPTEDSSSAHRRVRGLATAVHRVETHEPTLCDAITSTVEPYTSTTLYLESCSRPTRTTTTIVYRTSGTLVVEYHRTVK